jgi:hypothetical protein
VFRELVRVLATTPYELAEPRDVVVAANATTGPARANTINTNVTAMIGFLWNFFIAILCSPYDNSLHKM